MTLEPRPRIAIVTPVFNDWASLARLLGDLDAAARMPALAPFEIEILCVDDGSTEPCDPALFEPDYPRLAAVEVVALATNLGHQRAIATGLVLASRDPSLQGVIVMDCDGEDRPEDVARLIVAACEQPDTIIVARRANRSEGLKFQLFYRIYQAIFRTLTGQGIDFGNFSYLPLRALQALVLSGSLWNHLAATISRARIPRQAIATTRGKRYAGRSRMNLSALIIHGLSAISVYLDLVLVRIILAATFITALVLLAMLGVLGVRFLTDLAIPGWATSVMGLLAIMLSQALLATGVAVFQLLNQRGQRGIVPVEDAERFIRTRHALLRRGEAEPQA